MPPPDRADNLDEALKAGFDSYIIQKEAAFITFDKVGVDALANAFVKYPVIVKSILACVNVAGRAIKRDLGLTIDTYGKTISEEKAYELAKYLKPLLTEPVAIPSLVLLDHHYWIDKEMRAGKGRWELKILQLLNDESSVSFKKRKFQHSNSMYELDAAYPTEGSIEVGVDVKRYESPRDFHKRGDEITQKAGHLKSAHPAAKFYAVIYYPFPDRHQDVLARYRESVIDRILFGGETDESLLPAVKGILEDNGLQK